MDDPLGPPEQRPPLDPQRRRQLLEPGHDPDRLISRRRRHLGHRHLPLLVDRHQIGERAANVDTNPIHRCLGLLCARLQQRLEARIVAQAIEVAVVLEPRPLLGVGARHGTRQQVERPVAIAKAGMHARDVVEHALVLGIGPERAVGPLPGALVLARGHQGEGAGTEEYRAAMVEACADQDDELMELYLEGEEISEERIMNALKAATLAITVTPVLCGSSFKNKGVQPLLDIIVALLPSPVEVPPVEGLLPLKKGDEEREEATRPADDSGPFAALAFKVMSDPYVGKLTYFRVYSGTLEAGGRVLNVTTGKTERIGRLLMMHANSREEIERVYSGDICAGVGLKQTGTGDTLCAPDAPIQLESMDFPDTVIAVAIEPKTKSDQEKMGTALARLSEEDPTFKIESDEETGQTLIHGMGELHLEVLVDRMIREFNVEANVGKPQVAYRETIRKRVEKVNAKFARQTGGRGQYGHAVINIEPAPGDGFVFESKIKGGVIPTEYIPAVRQGITEALENGVKAGYPLVDLKVELIDGSYHDVDSSEMAFKIAGSMALQEGARKASPALLEPVMSVEVITPEDYLGDVIGDLSRRRGKVQGQEQRGNALAVQAFVPLSEMFGYATDLRSSTQGRAAYTMQFDKYEEVPSSIAEEISAHRSGTPGRGGGIGRQPRSRAKGYISQVRPAARLPAADS